MLRYIVKRLGYLLLVLFGASLLIFFLAQTIPADPAREALGEYASNDQIEAYRRARGLDRPVALQYLLYLRYLLHGDLGTSIMTGERVSAGLVRFLPATVELAVVALAISIAIGVTLGVASALNRGAAADHASRVTALFGMSMPVFWLGLMLQLIFYRHLAILPAGQRLSVELVPPPILFGFMTIDSLVARDLDAFMNALLHLAMPAAVLALGGLATIARITRSSLLEVLRAEYVRTARSKGLLERIVVYRHAFRNVLIPVVTVIGIQVGNMLSGAVLTETIFAWPGLGRWAVSAITRGDVPVVMGVALFTCTLYSLVNLVVDVSYLFIDPRLRAD